MRRDWAPISDLEFERQLEEISSGAAAGASIEADAVSYDTEEDRIAVEFGNGCVFAFPRKLAQGLHDATPAQLGTGRVLPGGETLRWDALDVDLSVAGLLAFVFGSRTWMQELGRAGGKSTGGAKAVAARLNGMKGGRPRAATVRERIAPAKAAKARKPAAADNPQPEEIR